ncbi:M48 family metallopeptidase [Dethiosulfatarculus sandiegensis]|uniref:Peptidase M48 domain-containing protein n=1 Tax=Dethiosulfatarculus sandiegensis TaxID=1429043 RepID=A0A0D2J7V9_9BACT|nr:M48 family metallopeptidase [Dethiosulfatarculus sandiegensis]KIX11806.1 hypothetical protein X474_22280 [Dethiosulfatarculus sandiegensis]
MGGGLGLWLVLLLLAFAQACVMNPVTGQDELSFMSVPQEIAMGKQYYPQTTQMNNGLPAKDPALQTYVKNVGGRLANLSHRPKVPWDFNVVNSSQVNAFALPGGKISITRGLISKMKNEDELASVLGHEIGHVTARHQAQQYTNQVLTGLALAGLGAVLAGEEWGQYGVMAAGTAASLLMLSYSRDMERQADALGYEYMTRAGYNPKGQTDTFKIFLNEHKESPSAIQAMLRSHPLTTERINTAQNRVLRTDPRFTNQPFKKRPFDRALAIQKRRSPAYAAMDKGDALLAKKNWKAAYTQYQQAIKKFPDEGLFHTKKAMALMKGKKTKIALKAAQKGARLSPNLYLSQHVEGLLLMQGGKFKSATNSFARARKLLPQSPENSLYLAYCLERTGRKKQAVSFYRKAAGLAPSSWVAQKAYQRLNAMGVYKR